jgi:hypothetical protein
MHSAVDGLLKVLGTARQWISPGDVLLTVNLETEEIRSDTLRLAEDIGLDDVQQLLLAGGPALAVEWVGQTVTICLAPVTPCFSPSPSTYPHPLFSPGRDGTGGNTGRSGLTGNGPSSGALRAYSHVERVITARESVHREGIQWWAILPTPGAWEAGLCRGMRCCQAASTSSCGVTLSESPLLLRIITMCRWGKRCQPLKHVV